MTTNEKTTWERACEAWAYHDPHQGTESAKIRAMGRIAFALCELVDVVKERETGENT